MVVDELQTALNALSILHLNDSRLEYALFDRVPVLYIAITSGGHLSRGGSSPTPHVRLTHVTVRPD